jgi:PIN domain nuclease of toxin-antitoxin system
MGRFLLDSCIFRWMIQRDPQLSDRSMIIET